MKLDCQQFDVDQIKFARDSSCLEHDSKSILFDQIKQCQSESSSIQKTILDLKEQPQLDAQKKLELQLLERDVNKIKQHMKQMLKIITCQSELPHAVDVASPCISSQRLFKEQKVSKAEIDPCQPKPRVKSVNQ